jgi:hypothetical protein
MDAQAKEPIISALRRFGVPPEKDNHVASLISFAKATTDDNYRSNIQIAELNAINAALAVIRWKKHREIYADIGTPQHVQHRYEPHH